jgi:hypothetical protein
VRAAAPAAIMPAMTQPSPQSAGVADPTPAAPAAPPVLAARGL